ncbi:MAG: tetratricopeptide repeat protein [Nitrospirota bacterium]
MKEQIKKLLSLHKIITTNIIYLQTRTIKKGFMPALIIILLILSFCAFSCSRGGSQSPQLSYSEQLLENMKKDYRLNPDRRFLLAISEIHHFFTGEDREDVKVSFNNGKWIITYKHSEVGVLPELPEFSDFMELLSHWVNILNSKYPLNISDQDNYQESNRIEEFLARYHAQYAMVALREIDMIWNNGLRNKKLLRDATEAWVILVYQSLDKIEMTDELTSKAISMLAISKALTEYNVVPEEILLAGHMNYSKYAMNLAKTLPEECPLRLYTLKKYKLLKEMAERPEANSEIRYLRLNHLVELRDIEGWFDWIESRYPYDAYTLPILKTAMDLNKFSIDKYLPDLLPHIVLFNIAKETRQFDWRDILANGIRKMVENEKSVMIKRLVSDLSKLGEKYKGPFLDAETVKKYYESYFYSSLFVQGIFYLDKLSSVEMVEVFSKELKDNKGTDEKDNEDKTAMEFQRWYRNLAVSKSGEKNPEKLLEDITTISSFGSSPLIRSFNELTKHCSFGDPKLFEAVKHLITKLDTRPSHRAFLGDIAYSSLLDLNLAEAMISNAVETNPSENNSNRVWIAYFKEDIAKLWETARSADIEPIFRIEALEYLDDDISNAENIKEIYEQLIKEFPKDYKISYKYVEFLRKNKEYGKARSVASNWLSLKVPTAGLEDIAMKNAIGRAFYEEGLYKKGLQYIKPVIESYQATSMIIAAKCMAKLNMHKEADRLFRQVTARYPDTLHVLMSYLKYLWETDRCDEASQLIKSWKYPLNAMDWRFEIGKSFANIYAVQPKKNGLKAFSALVNASLSPWDLRNIVLKVHETGNSELAFEMHCLFKENNIEFLMDGFRYLKEFQGKGKALNWLKSKIPSHMLNFTSMIIYRDGEYDLLWDLIENPEQENHPDFVWLMRAAAWSKAKKDLAQHKEKLVEYFTHNNNTRYHKYGRYLIGLEPVNDLLLGAKDDNSLCETAYYIGLRAQGEGRYKEASDWYHVSVETGKIKMGEYRWAYDELYRWYRKGKSLSLM